MTNEVETFEHAGMTARIFYDESGCGDPRDADNLATLFCWHPEYQLGDEQFKNAEGRGCVRCHGDHGGYFDTQEEVYRFLRKDRKATVILPLFLYDHSGITISAGARIDKLSPSDVDSRGRNPFDGAGWDTSWVGFAYTNEEARKYLGVKRSHAELERQIRVEIEEYDKFLRGEVFGYVITGASGHEHDGLWGLLGTEYAEQAAREACEEAAKDEQAKELNRNPADWQ